MRFTIHTDDHEPAHVHVAGDGRARIALVGADSEPILMDATRMKAGDIRKAVRIVAEQQGYLLARWRELHG